MLWVAGGNPWPPALSDNPAKGSLNKDVFERRLSTGNEHFSFLGSGFAQIFGQIVSIIETFRFGDENDYEYEIWLKVLFTYSLKIDIPESFIVLFSPE